jgi:hypothetical protein
MILSFSTGYGMDDRVVEFRYGQEFSLLPIVRTDFGAHSAFYSMGIGGAFLGSNATGT